MILYNELLEDRGATLLWTVQRLPALLDFRIRYYGQIEDLPFLVINNRGLPRCKELREVRSRSLLQLRVCMQEDPMEINTLRLGGMPALRSCELIGQPKMPLLLRIDAASFQEVPQLRRLRLEHDEGLQLQPGTLGRLTALTSLTLMGCGLRTVPAEVEALSTTLCELDLSYNHRMQVDDVAIESILKCGQLRKLGLYKPNIAAWKDCLGDGTWQRVERHLDEEGYTPAQYSVDSLSHMMQLPSAFCKLHGRDLLICITLEDHNKHLEPDMA